MIVVVPSGRNALNAYELPDQGPVASTVVLPNTTPVNQPSAEALPRAYVPLRELAEIQLNDEEGAAFEEVLRGASTLTRQPQDVPTGDGFLHSKAR